MKIKKISLLDISIFQLCIIMLAFNDWSSLVILSQILAFGMICLDALKKKYLSFDKSVYKYILYRALFILWGGIGLVASVYPRVVSSIITALCLRVMTGITILMYVRDNERRIKFMKYLITSGSVLCIRMLIVVPVSAWGSERVGIYLAHNQGNAYNFTGVTFAIGLIAAFLFCEKEAIKNTKIRILLIAVFSIFSLLTGSKKQIFFLAISILIYGICISKTPLKFLRNILWIVVSLTVLVFMILNVDALYDVIGERFIAFLSYFSKQNNSIADASTISRGLYLKDAWRVFVGHPILGVGFDCFRHYNMYASCWAENNFMELLADIGFIGLVLYYIIYSEMFKGIFKRIKKFHDFLDIEILIVLVCMLVVDFTMVSYPSSILQFHVAFLYASSIVSRTRRKNLREKS